MRDIGQFTKHSSNLSCTLYILIFIHVHGVKGINHAVFSLSNYNCFSCVALIRSCVEWSLLVLKIIRNLSKIVSKGRLLLFLNIFSTNTILVKTFITCTLQNILLYNLFIIHSRVIKNLIQKISELIDHT